ncbi:hypothetical protein CEQ90_15080 [Lewinellaceae bacterium SD302]|nr:hypothetical protein CEQ90_15080 [Lewinellaceae bacterium SD302]
MGKNVMPKQSKAIDPFQAFTYFVGFLIAMYLFLAHDPVYKEHRDKRNAPTTPTQPKAVLDSLPPLLSEESCAPFAEKVYAAYRPQEMKSRAWSVIPPGHRGDLNFNQVCDVFQHFNNWAYHNDPKGKDVIFPPQFAWDERFGDCDDRSVSLAAALGAIDCKVRLVGERFEAGWHLYPELLILRDNLGDFTEYVTNRYYLDFDWQMAYRPDGNHQYVWVNLDWSAKHPGGAYNGLGEGYFMYPDEGKCTPFSNTNRNRYAKRR